MSTAEIIVIWCFVGIIWSAISWLILSLMYTMGEATCDFFNPFWIYAQVRVNIFGCILLTILTNILCPVVAIGYWFYKICTVGKK